MYPEGRLSFNLIFTLGTGMMVDVVMVDMFRALSSYQGSAWAQGQRERSLVRTGDRRTGGPCPYHGLDSEPSPGKRPVLWRAGAG